jgi:hypothetical protein
MDFRIADTFTDSLARLTGTEQKAVKTTAFDLQLDPSAPSMRFHRIDRAKDPNFWSVRVNADIRLIVHRTAASLLLAPRPAAAAPAEMAKPPLFADVPDGMFLAYGVPPEWIGEVRRATEDTLLDLADHLPQEAGEALLNLATGTTPEIPAPAPIQADPFSHPDAQRRFRVLTNVEKLERAFDYPWDKWAVFLHPTQRRVAEAAVLMAVARRRYPQALAHAAHQLSHVAPDPRPG